MMMSRNFAAALCAIWFACTGGAYAECLGADRLEPIAAPLIPELGEASGALDRASGGRMVAPMMVNGQGPFRFIVDTGANRSAISTGLAERLALSPVGVGDVHTVSGIISAPLTQVDGFQYGGLDLAAGTVPIVDGAVLGGEQGLLGVDGMQGRRLKVDFENRCIEIVPSDRRMRRGNGWMAIQGELRFGHLVVIDGHIRGQRVHSTFAGSVCILSLTQVRIRHSPISRSAISCATASASRAIAWTTRAPTRPDHRS
jgi:hypothetical protein